MIINSLLDNDLYKYSMSQAVFHQFPTATVEYKFRCRNEGITFTPEQVKQIYNEIYHLCSLKFTKEELDYLRTIRFLKEDYIHFLSTFQLKEENVLVEYHVKDGHIEIKIAGPWLDTILFEVPILAIVNEVYFGLDGSQEEIAIGKSKLADKIKLVNSFNGFAADFKFADFGTRRRWSHDWQDYVIGELVKGCPKHFVGTSNVYFAKKYNVTPIGTMAHEWIQAGQALTNVMNSQKFMLQKWADEYRGDLGYALGDTLGMDMFLKDFDLYFAKLYDGVRQDSGDPYEYAHAIIDHYTKLKIDARTKTLIFSDNLTFEKARDLLVTFGDRIKISFGIGTNLTNDLMVAPLNIVIKMTKCNGQPVAKLSNSAGKCMCEDQHYLEFLKKMIGVK